MKKTFKQRDLFLNRKYFEISDKGLLVKEKGFTNRSEYFVEFDKIGTKRHKTTFGNIWWLIGGLFCLVISGPFYIDILNGTEEDLSTLVFFLMLGIVCLFVFFLTHKRSFYLLNPDNSNGIEFLHNKPSKLELEKFINELIRIRNTELEETYGEINRNLPYEQNYNNQLWLKNNNVISNDEFKIRISNLDNLYETRKEVIGFKNTN